MPGHLFSLFAVVMLMLAWQVDLSFGTDECTPMSVRLVGITAAEGRIEVCDSGMWRLVCSDSFNLIDGNVICRQLGFSGNNKLYVASYFDESEDYIALDCVTCTGEEDNIFDCNYQFYDFCVNYAVGIQCLNASEECTDKSIRLVDGNHTSSTKGRIEVCYIGTWWLVCSDFFNVTDGSVICRQLGFSGIDQLYAASYFDESEDYIALDYVACTGEEDSIFDCGYQFHHYCINHAVGIQCSSASEVTSSMAITVSVTVLIDSTAVPVTTSVIDSTSVLVTTVIYSIPVTMTDSTSVPMITVIDSTLVTSRIDTPMTTVIDSTSMPVINSVGTVAPPTTGANTGIYNTVVIGTVVIVLGLMGGVIVVFLIIFIIRTRRKRKLSAEHDLAMRMEALAVFARSASIHQNNNLFLEPRMHALQVFDRKASIPNNADVDHIDLKPRVNPAKEFSEKLMTRLIQPSDLKLLEKIGQGEFGIVYRGILIQHRNEHPLAVAVKTLKGFNSQAEIDDLMQEAEKMKSFDHLHVLTLTGICVGLLESPCLIMPFMSNGSLLSYLRKVAPNLTVSESADENLLLDAMKQLLSMCLQVAKGMAYLAKQKFVHRDLAARNCMISSDGVIKVADFGLAEDMYTAEYFKQERSSDDSVKLPVKWMALESIHYGKFSEKTDVWSYGILCWEVFSVGKSPYPGMTPKEVVDMLDSGERISKPSNPACREEVFSLIMTCWKFSPDERPGFADIVKKINKILVPLAEYMDFSFTA